ncbi:LysR substrate binding domain-containing protein [Leucobacter luti]|uniref:LysR substrate binding domain-containing protein n=1 Tax=Leucobacter luti TaxID=340320 RepID=A0A4R6S6Y1_9MICO|nr:LysR substrate-binding domain-containing protein [Leucobacter luti]MCW2288712.1 hypothetical protein [Leucobacter luti]TCK45133.1 LysR substrate binding domain-containing protein [Leucobacter luti]TDP95659.1 LysR substrate binding domain-containing protein [Leucobacter luti]
MSDNPTAAVDPVDPVDPVPQTEPTRAPAAAVGAAGPAPLRLGFARGIAPSTWAQRWEVVSGNALELAPVNVAYGRSDTIECDVMLERTLPGLRPAGSETPNPTRHALRLYLESVTLVVPAEHDLAKLDAIALTELDSVPLIAHPFHPAEWPAPVPWNDPTWTPQSVPAALELVATGAGAIMLPTLLARHLTDKRKHSLVPVTGVDDLPLTSVWATWDIDRDAADVQQLVGVLRGRTARSSRTPDEAAAEAARRAAETKAQRAARKKAAQAAQQPQSKKAGPKPGSRGAQLAATRKKPPHRGRR